MQPCALVLAFAVACAADGPTATVHRADGSTVRVALEVVNTPATRERGMMYRTALAEDHGMLFVFPDEVVRSFWMKNTLIPLDMLFIARDGRIVGIAADAVPLSMASRSVGQPSLYVLEVNGGWAARHGVRAGDRVEFRGVP
ncbi:MAG: DUF192 domain-containing protein, partial [Gemmatimonadetes bacterium]|nr:DUF192 domain-containing protein [Gemmatimonadota bacterium]